MISDMSHDGLESLIPKKSDKGDGPEEEIEFRLPDVTGGIPKKQPVDLSQSFSFQLPSVIKPQPQGSSKQNIKTGDRIFHIELEKIDPNPHQPRRHFDEEGLRELANSIREFGILQPLIVSKIEEEIDSGQSVRYELIAGERRLKAAKILGLPTVPVIVRNAALDVEKLEMAVIENIQRTDLNAIESARAMARLQDEFGMTQREIASKLGKSRESVSNTVRLLSLPSEIQNAVAEGKINESQGRVLLSLEDPKLQSSIFAEILKDNLSVRQLESRIRKVKNTSINTGNGEKENSFADVETRALQEQLEEFLGTKVEVMRDGKSGKIVINFYSQEELNAVLKKFFKQNGSQPF